MQISKTTTRYTEGSVFFIHTTGGARYLPACCFCSVKAHHTHLRGGRAQATAFLTPHPCFQAQGARSHTEQKVSKSTGGSERVVRVMLTKIEENQLGLEKRSQMQWYD